MSSALIPPPHARSDQTGFSLVEVLVTIIILSIGMLGAAGMQAASLQANTQTRYQVIAAALAGELAESMRGNHLVAQEPLATANPYLVDYSSGTLAEPEIDCQSETCSGNTDADRLSNAQWQVHEWMTRVQSDLPSPRVRICFDSTPFDSTGQAKWDCDDTGGVLVAKLAWTRINTQGSMVFGSTALNPLVVIPVTAGSAR